MADNTSGESPGKALSEALCTIAVASSIVSMVLGAIYWMSRAGFDNPAGPVVKSVGVALLFIDAPYLLWFRGREGESRWTGSYPFLWLIVFAAIPAMGRVQIELGVPLSIPFAALGFLAFLVVTAMWGRITNVRSALLLVPGSALFATWTAGVVWGRIYKSPVFIETMIATGVVHHDPLAVAAVGNMLRTYHQASPGLDGLPYMAYHWGTPWIFAQLSNLTDTSVLIFYQLGYAVTMIPLFFGSALTLGAIVRHRGGAAGAARVATRDPLFWGIFVAATIGFIPVAGMDALGVWTSNLTISESYGAGIPVALMLLCTMIQFWRERGAEVTEGATRWTDYAFLAFVLPAGLVALGYLKISLLVLGFAAAAYAAVRSGLLRRPRFLAIFLVVAAVIYVGYDRTSLKAHHEGIAPFDFLRGFVPAVWWPFFVLFQWLWPLLYTALRLHQEEARTAGDVVLLVKNRRILDVEILALVAVAGILPGFILHIDGGSAFYFSDIQRWMAAGLLMGSINGLVRRPARIRFTDLRTIAIAFVALPLAVSAMRNGVHWTIAMLKANAGLRTELYEAAGSPASGGVRSLLRLRDPQVLAKGLAASPNFVPVRALEDLARTPLDVKRQTAVFVPQSDTAYWSILKRPGACSFSSFLVPSLTGMSMVDGMPPAGCELSRYYGLSLYEKRARPQMAADVEPAALCARASRLGFSRVLVLRFDPSGQVSQQPVECRS